MKKLLFLIFTFCALGVAAQTLRPAISYSYLFDRAADHPQIGLHEFTLNVNLVYEVSPRINLGLQYLDIRTRGSAYTFSEERNNFYIAGLLFQYDFLHTSQLELFPELSINYGNYCPCGQTDPFRQEGIIYLGYGFGFDIPLTKRLFLDTGLHYYRPIRRVDGDNGVYSYGQYILGLSYSLF